MIGNFIVGIAVGAAVLAVTLISMVAIAIRNSH